MAMAIQDAPRAIPKKSAVEIQQDYYEAVGDADWELYEKKHRKYLLQKIAVALCGPPTKEGNLDDVDDLRLEGYEKREEEITMKVFNKICEQEKGCRIFIDHDGRVYQCWDDYLTENKLRECVMVVPKNGEYKGTLGMEIGLDSAEARAAWINIMVSTAGISVTGASKILSWAAATGTNVEILMNAVSILQYTNLGTGAIGVANSLWDMVSKYHKYDEPPSALEIFQFTTSVLFLGIGAMSNQTAQEIVQDAQARTINEIRESLPSNVKKKMFDKVTGETRRVQGTIQGNADIIKALKTIDNKSDFFAKLARINKELNKNKIRISLAPDGNPLFNNQHSINVNDLSALGKKGREQLFQKYGPAKVTSRNAPTRIYASTSSDNAPLLNQDVQCYIRPEEIIKITNFILTLSRIDQELIAQILSEISGNFHDAFLLLCVEIINSLIPEQIDLLISSLDKNYKVKIVIFVFNYIKSKIPVNEDVDITFGNVLHEYISNGKISPRTIIKIMEKLMEATNKSRISDDSTKYDGMHNFFKRKVTGFVNLEVGEVVTIGEHDILVKGNTVDNLDEWLEMFSQQQCDIFMSLCYKIISNLSSSEVNELIEVNFDEDIILRVVTYLLFEKRDDIIDLILSDCVPEILNDDVVSRFKDDMLHWRWIQIIRKYKQCDKCRCICFI